MSPHIDVLFVLVRSGGDAVYGGERSTTLTARILEEQGIRTHFILTADDGFARMLEAAKLTYEVVPVGNPFAGIRSASWRGRAERLVQILRVNRRIYHLARSSPGCLVHTMASPGLYCALVGARASRSRCLWHVRDVSRIRRTRWFESAGILLADRTIAISDSLRTSLFTTAWAPLHRWLAGRIDVVYNAFDFDVIDRFIAAHTRVDCQRALGVRSDRVHAVMVGAINDKKGQLRFLERVLPATVAQVPDLLVTFIGGVNDEGYMADCQAAIERRRLASHVRFAGYLAQEDVYRFYLAADLAIVASDREGLSRFAVEAQAFGLPVASTRIPGPMDVVEEGATGFLVSNDHIEEMVTPLVRLCQDPVLRSRLGLAGALNVRMRFSMACHRDALSAVYQCVAGARLTSVRERL